MNKRKPKTTLTRIRSETKKRLKLEAYKRDISLLDLIEEKLK